MKKRIKNLIKFVLGKGKKFDANAVDGDNDGLVQDGTLFERPAVLTVDGAKAAAIDLAADVIDGAAEVAKDYAKELKKAKAKKK